MKKEYVIAALLGGLCGVSFGQDAIVTPAAAGYDTGISTPVVTLSTATSSAPVKKKTKKKAAAAPAKPSSSEPSVMPATPAPAPTSVK